MEVTLFVIRLFNFAHHFDKGDFIFFSVDVNISKIDPIRWIVFNGKFSFSVLQIEKRRWQR